MSIGDGVPLASSGNNEIISAETRERSVGQIVFSVSRSQLLVRLIKNKLFGILTLGIYRFWAKTHVRRILWNGANIEGDRLEYMGTAKELFLGFLIAMVILLPLMLIAGLFVELMALTGESIGIFGQIANFAVLYMFWQFARYRLWRYRLSRTSWRGIRFFLTGSAIKYALNVLLWTAVAIVTLGWAYPVLRAYILKYRLNNTCFGDGEFAYHGTVGGLYRIYWPFILIAQLIVGISGVYLFNHEILSVSGETGLTLKPENFNLGHTVLFFGGALVIFVTLSILSFAVKVGEFRYIAEETTFGPAGFTSDLTIRSVLYIFALLVVFGVFGYVGFGLLIILIAKYASTLFVVAIIPAFLGGLIVFEILKVLFLLVPLIKTVCHSLTIHNFEVFEHAAANAEKSPKYGEGFADAMDVGAF